jgi:N-acetylglucosaminyldiphosphoundecaprenol N-acetyl-beta-D-mannosaminyltransferase
MARKTLEGNEPMELRNILDLPIAASNYGDFIGEALGWARSRESKAICFVTVHGVMEAYDKPGFKSLYSKADRLNPDGMPLVWGLRALGVPCASRVYGPDTTEMLLAAAEENSIPVGFYGASDDTLNKLIVEVKRRWPAIDIVYRESPPFRKLTAEEDEETVRKITESGARFLFVGLGCPKQEEWVVRHRGQIPAVLLAVGAAFDFIAGTKPQAPRWMMAAGLEWVFRLATEPRRLFKRYVKHNFRFMYLFSMQWLRERGTTA